MSQRQWIVIIGVWVMVFLFIGFPSSWEKAFAILTGLVIIVFAYRIRFKENSSANSSSFTDNISSDTKQGGQTDNTNDQVSMINDQGSASVIPAPDQGRGQAPAGILSVDKPSSVVSPSSTSINQSLQASPDAEE
jgi:hypothetical protein